MPNFYLRPGASADEQQVVAVPAVQHVVAIPTVQPALYTYRKSMNRKDKDCIEVRTKCCELFQILFFFCQRFDFFFVEKQLSEAQ